MQCLSLLALLFDLFECRELLRVHGQVTSAFIPSARAVEQKNIPAERVVEQKKMSVDPLADLHTRIRGSMLLGINNDNEDGRLLADSFRSSNRSSSSSSSRVLGAHHRAPVGVFIPGNSGQWNEATLAAHAAVVASMQHKMLQAGTGLASIIPGGDGGAPVHGRKHGSHGKRASLTVRCCLKIWLK